MSPSFTDGSYATPVPSRLPRTSMRGGYALLALALALAGGFLASTWRAPAVSTPGGDDSTRYVDLAAR